MTPRCPQCPDAHWIVIEGCADVLLELANK
jgi:hypothetical protein